MLIGGTVGLTNNNGRLDGHFAMNNVNNNVNNGNGANNNIVNNNQNNNRRRELLFLFYFVLIFIAVRIWIIIISSNNEYVIILSAVFTGLIFALLCFRCRMIPRNNENNAANRNSDAINDFHAFLLQTGNVTHSQGHNRDRALSPELLSALECFAYNNKHSLDQTGKFHENSHDIASNSVDFAYHKPSDPDLVESIHEGGIESNRASPRLHSRISHEDLESIYSNNNNNNNELQRVFPSGIHPSLALQPASADSADPSAALLSARSDVTRDEFSCAICLSDYQPLDLLLRLPCAHVYHKSCVSAWFSQHNTCPLCKQNVPLLMQSQNGIAPLAVEANLGNSAPAASAATSSSSSSATVGNDRTGGYSPFTTNSRSSAVLPSSQLDIV